MRQRKERLARDGGGGMTQEASLPPEAPKDDVHEMLSNVPAVEQRGRERYVAVPAKTPAIVLGLGAAVVSLHFLLVLPFVLTQRTFRGERVGPRTYALAVLLALAGGGLLAQHAALHKHTYCEVSYQSRHKNAF